MDSRSKISNNKTESANPLVTIIVPVYQVEQYLSECVESLIYQTYDHLEIILVDDGSTDGSRALCDEYSRRDDRIRVIHQENQGLSGARNTGLDHANGEYVAFVDSDDFVASTYIEVLYNLLIKYHADIAACAFKKSTACGGSARGPADLFCFDRSIKEMCMSSEQMLRQWHGRYKKYETVIWNKLYHRSVLSDNANKHKIRFPEGKRHEDVLTSHRLIENARRIVLVTQILYLYRVRAGSITNNVSTREAIEQNLSAQRERMEFFKDKRYIRAYLNLWIGYVLHLLWFAVYRWRNRL